MLSVTVRQAPRLCTYIRVGLDLSQSVLVKLSSVTLERLEAVGVLDTNSVTLRETTLVDVGHPGNLSLDLDFRLEGDNVFALDDVALLGERSRKSCGERGSDWGEISTCQDSCVLENYSQRTARRPTLSILNTSVVSE